MTDGARVVTANREQRRWDMIDLEAWLPAEHKARIIVAFVASLDLSRLYAKIAARDGAAGRPALDPQVLLALWLYALSDGVMAARELSRLSESDLAYKWLRGDMPLNHHTLSDFLTVYAEEVDQLLSDCLAALEAEGLIDLGTVIIDGSKVRANAGRESFKTEAGLLEAERRAKARMAELRAELMADPEAGSRRRRAARERAAREMMDKAARAKAARDRLAAERAKRANREAEKKRPEAKASTTDCEARLMRFADGAVAPGYNMQVAAVPTGFVLAIRATDRRNDQGLAAPMVEEVARRLGRAPARIVVDKGFAAETDIPDLAARPAGPVEVYAPVPPERAQVKPETLRRRARRRLREPAAVQEWRVRMGSAAARLVMKARRGIELVNAHLKQRGIGRQLLRGLGKVQAVVTLQALTHNALTAARLRAAAAHA